MSPVASTRALRAATLVALVAAAGCGGGSPGAPARAVPGRVLLLGLDGADWQRLDPLIEGGALPSFAGLRAGGATGVLRSEDPMLSPILWTSIATGRTPAVHGVVSFLTRDSQGREIPVTAHDVGARPVWRVVSDQGETAGVVGWYATWPAASLNGFVVSDRIAGHQVGRDDAPREGLVDPPDLLAPVEQTVAAIRIDLVRDLFPFFRLSPAERAATVPVNIDRSLAESFGAVQRGVLVNASLGLRLWSERPTRLLAVYLEAPDAVLHLFGEFEPPRRPEVADGDYERYQEVVPRYLRFLDGWLGRFMDALGPDDTLVVVSDHGFRGGAARPAGSPRAGTGHAPAWHQKDGLVAVWGAGAAKGARLPPSGLYDVAPTVLRLLDLALARDLDGHPIDAALAGEVRRRPLRSVPSFGPPDIARDRAVPEPTPVDDERLALLRSLGYLGGPTGDDRSATLEETYNRGLVLMLAGDLDGASRAFRELEDLAPGRGLSQLGLGEVAWRRGALARAERLFDEAAARMPRSVLPVLDRALVRMATGNLTGARGDFTAVIAVDPSRFVAHRGLGAIELRENHPAEALAHLERARKVAADGARRADASYLAGLALVRLGRGAEAEERFRAALRDQPDHPDSLARLAALALDGGRPAEAVDLLRRLVRARPSDPRARRMLADALDATGQSDEAGRERAEGDRLEAAGGQ